MAYEDYTGMFGDKYTTAAMLDDSRVSEAHSMGQLSSYGMGQASAFYQAAMGSPFAAAMMQKQHPLMQKQNMLDEIRRKHPNPDTAEELHALANDLMEHFPEYAIKVKEAAIEATNKALKDNIATKDQISVIGNHLTLGQNSDPMIDAFLSGINEDWDDLTFTEKEPFRKTIRGKFGEIIKGYEQWLTTQGLSPDDVNDMLFTSEGQQKNVGMFKHYLGGIKDMNPFAAHLHSQNVQILNEMVNDGGVQTKTNGSMSSDGSVIKVDDGKSTVYFESTINENEKQTSEMSQNEYLKESNKASMELMDGLDKIWWSMVNVSGAGIMERYLSPTELKEEQKEDDVQAWIRREAFNHFKGLPKERFEAFQADPNGYYRKYILLDEGKIRENTENEVIKLWAL